MIPILHCIHSMLLPYLFFLGFAGKAIDLKGKITDEEGKGLPYVNIGIPGKNVGTVSGEDGAFALAVDTSLFNDKVKISCIGYEEIEYPVSDLVKGGKDGNLVIKLKKSFSSLQEVVVHKTFKIKVLGNTSHSKFMSGGFSSSDLGSEAGTRIKIRKDRSYLKKVNFNISYNKLDSIRVRLNIYKLKDGVPDVNILPENVILNLNNKQTGEVEIDLSKYNLVVHDDLLVSLELLASKGDPKSSIFISASLLGAPTFYRQTSQAKWKEYKSLSLGINATVAY